MGIISGFITISTPRNNGNAPVQHRGSREIEENNRNIPKTTETDATRIISRRLRVGGGGVFQNNGLNLHFHSHRPRQDGAKVERSTMAHVDCDNNVTRGSNIVSIYTHQTEEQEPELNITSRAATPPEQPSDCLPDPVVAKKSNIISNRLPNR